MILLAAYFILLLHRATNVRRFGMIRSHVLAYMLDGDLDEPATA